MRLQPSSPSKSTATLLALRFWMCLYVTKSSVSPVTMLSLPKSASCQLTELLVLAVSASKPLVLVAQEAAKALVLLPESLWGRQRPFHPFPPLSLQLRWTASHSSTRRMVRPCTRLCRSRSSSTGPTPFCSKSSKRGTMTRTSVGSPPSWMPGPAKTFASPQRTKLLLGPTESSLPTAILMELLW
jgi:hypothetical protein